MFLLCFYSSYNPWYVSVCFFVLSLLTFLLNVLLIFPTFFLVLVYLSVLVGFSPFWFITNYLFRFCFRCPTKWAFTFVSIFQMWRDGMLAVGEFLDVWWLSWHWRWDVQTKGIKKAQQTLTPNKSIYLKISKVNLSVHMKY